MSCGQFHFDKVKPSEVRVTYRFECVECGEELEVTVYGEYIQMPSWPGIGWQYVNKFPDYSTGCWICPKHEVEVKITEKP